ncbi:hypothetical protein PMAYCL1PPCAC_14271, partial [Pristionchus mayeri]
TGVTLRRSLAEFLTFTTRLEEEKEGSTRAQLEQTLKSIDSFHRALGATRSALERMVIEANDCENMLQISTPSVDSVPPPAFFPLPVPSPDHLSMVRFEFRKFMKR